MAEQEDDVQVVGSSPKKKKKKGSPPQYGGPKTNAAAAAGMRPEDAASLGRAPSPRSEGFIGEFKWPDDWSGRLGRVLSSDPVEVAAMRHI